MRKLHSYSVDFKINAMTFHKQGNSKEATARKLGVDSKRIREWCKQEGKLQAAKTGGNVSTPTRQDILEDMQENADSELDVIDDSDDEDDIPLAYIS